MRSEHDIMFTSSSVPKKITNCLLVYLTHVSACGTKTERDFGKRATYPSGRKGRRGDRREELREESERVERADIFSNAP